MKIVKICWFHLLILDSIVLNCSRSLVGNVMVVGWVNTQGERERGVQPNPSIMVMTWVLQLTQWDILKKETIHSTYL